MDKEYEEYVLFRTPFERMWPKRHKYFDVEGTHYLRKALRDLIAEWKKFKLNKRGIMHRDQELLKRVALSLLPEEVPFLTNDPLVNHAVDQHIEDQKIRYDEKIYEKEISEWKKSGGLLIGWIK